MVGLTRHNSVPYGKAETQMLEKAQTSGCCRCRCYENTTVKGSSPSRWTLCVSIAVVFAAVAVSIAYHELSIKPHIRLLQQYIDENREELLKLRSMRRRVEQWQIRSTFLNHTLQGQPARFKRNAGFELVAAHLVGISGPNIRPVEGQQRQGPQPGHYFLWTESSPNAFSMMETEDVEGSTAFIRILINGYYFVYSQVTYYGQGLFDVGHETVLIEGGTEIVLMQSINTQQLASAKSGSGSRAMDSGSHCGIFRLWSGQKIGVRPIEYDLNHVFMTDPDKAFFGAYLVHG